MLTSQPSTSSPAASQGPDRFGGRFPDACFPQPAAQSSLNSTSHSARTSHASGHVGRALWPSSHATHRVTANAYNASAIGLAAGAELMTWR